MSCNITYASNGEVKSVNADNGNTSLLYKEATKKFGKEQGLEIYLASKSDYFQDNILLSQSELDENNEPKLKTVLNYLSLQNESKEPLTTQQKLDLKNIALGVENFSVQKLVDAFYSDGIFNVSPKKLKKSGLYSDYEIANLANDIDLQQTVKQSLEAIKNTEGIEIEEEFVENLEKTAEINSFGKLTNINPNLVQKEVLNKLAGTTEEEFEANLAELEYPSFQKSLDKPKKAFVPQKTTQPIKTESTSAVISKEQDVKAFNEGVDFVQQVAEDYKKSKNIKGVSHPKVLEIYPQISQEISAIYEQSEASSTDQNVADAYKALEDETIEQYKFITEKGLKVERWSGKGEPYASSKEMLNDLKNNKHLYFLPNDEAFGSDTKETEGRIGLKKTEVYLTDGYQMTVSEVFRVVHDYFGHGILGNQFGAIGEENATLQHLDLYSQQALPAVIFQTRGQNSWVNFSGTNKVALEKMREARQKKDNNLLEEAQKMFTFAQPKDNILPNKYNFKKYETARRIKEQSEIDKSPNQYGSNEISKLLPTISRANVVERGINRKSTTGDRQVQSYVLKDVVEVALPISTQEFIKKAFPQITTFPKIYEIIDGSVYRELQIRGLEGVPMSKSVTIYTAEEYNQMRMFITEDGHTGITLTKDGHLGGAFSSVKSGRKADLAQLMVIGIKEGATNAEAYDTFLPNYYSNFGFKAVSRVEFNENIVENWDYEEYANFNQGKPDVVHFIYDGGDRNTVEERLGQFDLYSTYQKEETKFFDKNSYYNSYSYMEQQVVKRYDFENKIEAQDNQKPVQKKSEPIQQEEQPTAPQQNYKEQLFQEMQGYKKAEVFMEVDGEIVQAKNTNTAIILPLVAKQIDNIEDINKLQQYDLEILQANQEDTVEILKGIETDLIGQGIDVAGLADKEINAELMSFLGELEVFINNPTVENTKAFADVYDAYFEKDLSPKTEIIKAQETDRDFVKLNTNLSEEQVYEQQGLIKVKDGLYIRTNKQDLNTLYSSLETYTEKYPKDTNLKEYVQTQIATSDFKNSDNAEAVYLYKMYFDINDIPNNIIVKGDVTLLKNKDRTMGSTIYYDVIKGINNIGYIELTESPYYFQTGNVELKITKQGIGTDIYTALSKHLSKPLLSDSGRSEDAEGLWSKLERMGIAESYEEVVNVNTERTKKSFIRKRYRTFTIKKVVPTKTNVNFTGNYEYLTTEFVSDFYIEMLKEREKNSEIYKNFYSNFDINENGIYLKNEDSITMSQVKEYLNNTPTVGENISGFSQPYGNYSDYANMQFTFPENRSIMVYHSTNADIESIKKDGLKVGDLRGYSLQIPPKNDSHKYTIELEVLAGDNYNNGDVFPSVGKYAALAYENPQTNGQNFTEINYKGLWLFYDTIPSSKISKIIDNTTKEVVYSKKQNNKNSKTFENLKQYSIISKQMPLLTEQEIQSETKQVRRDAILNSPQNLEKYQGQYHKLNDNNLILKNSDEEFIKVGGNIFEAVDTDGNLTLYSRLNSIVGEYYTFKNEAPKTNVKIEDYSYLNTQPDSFMTEKKYLSKSAKEKINRENFDCI